MKNFSLIIIASLIITVMYLASKNYFELQKKEKDEKQKQLDFKANLNQSIQSDIASFYI